ncbi:uncharacterized protein [Miscanthus floridulus]|uniref:uncharacterized protein n=1 Tax=Miscanthus floridulus TaxID=154761 RepID=UPI003459A43F
MAPSGNMADLPGDIVRCIAGRVAPECRQRMRAVCSAWSAAVPAEPLPWILLQPDDGTAAADAAERGGFSVLSLPTDSKLPLSITTSAGSGPGPGQRVRCFGAGHGWLALVGADLSVTLRNPVTGHAISLPPLTRHPMVGADGLREDGLVLWRTWLDWWPDSGDLVPAEEFRDTYVRKVVFSARPRQDDYFAVVLGGYHSYAMYARAGATAWETLRDADGRALSLVHDVVHVEGGLFLAVTRCHGKVLVLDLAIHGNAEDDVDDDDGCTAAATTHHATEDDDDYCYSPSVSTFADPLVMTESLDYFVPGADMHVENHLVLIDGELYQIWAAREAEPLPPEEHNCEKKLNRYHIADVGVVRYALTAAGDWEAAAAADLGDWAVLVGRNETVAVCSGDVSGVSASCVYFIAGELEEVVCAFRLRSGRAEPVGGDVLRHACATPLPPVWFLPSLK